MQYFSGLKNALRLHYVFVLLSLFVAIVYVFPHIYFAYSVPEYQGVYISRSYDEDVYNAMVRQVYDGAPVTENPYIVEYKDKSVISFYKYIELAIGTIGKLIGVPMSDLAVLSKFVFPPLILLSIYLFVYSLTKDKYMANLASLFVLVGSELAPLNIGSAIKTFLFDSPFHSFLFFNRPINPQVSAIFFFLSLYSIAKVWESPTSKKWIIGAGVLSGIMAYVYFYFWNFLLVFLGIVCIYLLCCKDRSMLKAFASVLFLALAVSLPFVIDIVSMLVSGGASISKNYILTHRFIIEKVVVFPLLIFFLVKSARWIIFKISKKDIEMFSLFDTRKFVLLGLLLVSAFVVSNQQVIHGYEIQQHHYHFHTNIPIFIVSISIILITVLRRVVPRYLKPIVLLVGLIVSIHGISVQASSYTFWKHTFTQYQSYGEIFDWLQHNTPTNDVIYANNVLSELIPVYTHNAVYGSLHSSAYPVPLERLEHNYFVYMYMQEVTPEKSKDFIYTHRNEIGQYIYEGQYYRALCGSFGCFPDAVLDDLIKKYRLFSQESLYKNLKKYTINYLVYDPRFDSAWEIEQFTFLKKVFSNDGVNVYSVK